MKRIKHIVCAVVLAMGLVSCSVTRHSAFAPSITQLTIQMEDLEYLGESEITVEYRCYLGSLCVIDKINGEVYTKDTINSFPIQVTQGITGDLLPNLDRAAYKLTTEYPEADYFIITSQTSQRYQLFLGSQVEAKAKVKAYSFKK